VIAVDTNLLVYAHRGGLPAHRAARAALEEAAASSSGWGIPQTCAAEFWSIVTHPASQGRPSTPSEAAGFINALTTTGGAHLWQPGPGFAGWLLRAAEVRGIHGPRIFDLQIAATAAEAGASEIWTHDQGFVAVPGLRVRDPFARI